MPVIKCSCWSLKNKCKSCKNCNKSCRPCSTSCSCKGDCLNPHSNGGYCLKCQPSIENCELSSISNPYPEYVENIDSDFSDTISYTSEADSSIKSTEDKNTDISDIEDFFDTDDDNLFLPIPQIETQFCDFNNEINEDNDV